MHPFPVFENERIVALRQTRILDGEPNIELNNAVELARDMFAVPICLISVLDVDRQWFKAKCGLEVSSTDRKVAFCNYTILSSEVFIVEDAMCDPRFASNSLVLGAPHIRFYAGAPLVLSPGIALGSLCLIDTKPRCFTDAEATALQKLASVVTGLIRSHSLTFRSLELTQDVETQRQIVLKQARELGVIERRFEQTERMAGIGAWALTLATNAVEWSEETYRICGVPPGTPIDLKLAVSIYPEAERVRLHALIERAIRDGTGYDDEFEIVTLDGVHKWVRAVGDVELQNDVPHLLFGTIQDVTERHQTEAKLWNFAYRDPLTGLPNRRHFNEILPRAFACSGSPGLLIIDADLLKEVNDALGHAAGDALLRMIGHRLTTVVGCGATVMRLSGDEFAVLVPTFTSPEALRDLAYAILDAIQAPFDFQGSTIKPQVSIGGAIGLPDDPESLCQQADLALHCAKETGRGSYLLFREDLRSRIVARIAAVHLVDEALSCGDVLAWYQPIVDISRGRVSGLEALARVKQGDVFHSIGEFVEALQDRRIAKRLTSQMLARIEADVLAWKAQGMDIPRIALNAGSADFQDGRLETLILETCERCGISPDQFSLEVTESVFLSRDADNISATAKRLRDHGVMIALDDFGTGYASLAHLGTFPVDVIKIDRSFVAQITEPGPKSMISSTLIDLGLRMNIEVIAEGVETEAQLERLVRLRCKNFQGYLFSRPLPPNEIVNFLRSFVYNKKYQR